MMARHLSGHEIGVGATARIARPAQLSQGVAGSPLVPSDLKGDRFDKKTGSGLAEDYFVNQNSGMAGVVPAWKRAQLLHETEPTHPGPAGGPKLDAARAR